MDACCTLSSLPEGTSPSGQGALQVNGSSSGYYHVYDGSGNQVTYESLNKAVNLGEGNYQVKVSGSSHPVSITHGSITTCTTGALIVTGSTSEYYYVLDSAGQQLTYETLGKSSSLFASDYFVKVNESQTPATVAIGRMTEVPTGTIWVRGNTGEYYYVQDAAGKQLNYAGLETPLAYLPGTYVLKVNNTLVTAEVRPGQVSEHATGTVLTKGMTEEYYYLVDSLGVQLNYQALNKALAVFPGNFKVKVNNSVSSVRVDALQTSELTTGSLVVSGQGPEYYYVFNLADIQLNYSARGRPLSFFAAEYRVKLGEVIRQARITAGMQTSISF